MLYGNKKKSIVILGTVLGAFRAGGDTELEAGALPLHAVRQLEN